MVSVGIVGSGFIGRGWAVCFARGGHDVRLWDPAEGAAAAARDYIAAMLPDLAANDMLNGRSPDAILASIHVTTDLSAALAGVSHVQENAPEEISLKRRLFADLDAALPGDVVIASSTSALLPSAFTEALAGRGRCIVAHPVNPPHLIPLVELVPAPWTLPDTVTRCETLMQGIGQTPVRVEREIDGFLLNRLQAAVLDEAFRLVAGGYGSPAAVDACMRDGLAARWSLMGLFETIDLNAPGGVRDYVERYEPNFKRMTATMRDSVDWAGPVLEVIAAARRSQLPTTDLPARQMWRDRRLMALAAYHRSQS